MSKKYLILMDEEAHKERETVQTPINTEIIPIRYAIKLFS
jgi:hypothetical protein